MHKSNNLGQVFKTGLYFVLSTQGCSKKLTQMNLDLKGISETILNHFTYMQLEFKGPQFALVCFTMK